AFSSHRHSSRGGLALQYYAFAPSSEPGRWLGAGGKLILFLLEQNIERGQRAIAASDVLLELELIGITEFIARVQLLLEHAQVVADHNDLMKERLQRHFLRLH